MADIRFLRNEERIIFEIIFVPRLFSFHIQIGNLRFFSSRPGELLITEMAQMWYLKITTSQISTRLFGVPREVKYKEVLFGKTLYKLEIDPDDSRTELSFTDNILGEDWAIVSGAEVWYNERRPATATMRKPCYICYKKADGFNQRAVPVKYGKSYEKVIDLVQEFAVSVKAELEQSRNE